MIKYQNQDIVEVKKIRIKLNQDIDYNLISKVIDFNIKHRDELKTFGEEKCYYLK